MSNAPLHLVENDERGEFRAIGEVAAALDIPQHVLRFWETKFKQIKPVKRRGGHRYFRAQDVGLIREIKTLLYEKGFTIKGAQKYLSEKSAVKENVAARSNPSPVPQHDLFGAEVAAGFENISTSRKADNKAELKAILNRLKDLRELLKKS